MSSSQAFQGAYRISSPTPKGVVAPKKIVQQQNFAIELAEATLSWLRSPCTPPLSLSTGSTENTFTATNDSFSPRCLEDPPSYNIEDLFSSNDKQTLAGNGTLDGPWGLETSWADDWTSDHREPPAPDPHVAHDMLYPAGKTANRQTSEDPIKSDPKKYLSVAALLPDLGFLSEEIPCAQQSSRHPFISCPLLPRERSVSSTETSSVGSLESDITEDESAEAGSLQFQENSDIDSIPLERRAAVLGFTDLFTQALLVNDVPWQTASPLRTNFMALVEPWRNILTAAQSVANGDSTPPSSSSIKAGSTPDRTQSSQGSRKRTLDDNDQDSPDRDDNRNSAKKQKRYGSMEAKSREKWACPFYQREPHRYCFETELGDFRKCARSPGFDQVHRVKDHIYKCHSPKYCERCYTVFKEEDDLTNHRRMSPACDVKSPQQVEGLNSEQKKLLKPRDRRSKSDAERWQTIYKICFPGDEIIPSPYYVHYSREIAELRREVFAIIEGEARSPGPLDVNQMLQRLHGAFNSQFSTQHPATAVPQTLNVLTPPTAIATNISAGRSSAVPPQDEYQEITLRSSSMRVTEANREEIKMIEPTFNSSNGNSTSILNTGPAIWYLSATHIPGIDNSSVFGSVSPLPIRYDLSQIEDFDFDTFLQQNDTDEIDYSHSLLRGNPYTWSCPPEASGPL